jgi:hypothetical protein
MGGALVKGILGGIMVIVGLLLTLTGIGAFPGLILLIVGIFVALWGFIGDRRTQAGR